MASLLNVSIDVSSLPKEKFVKGKDGKVWYEFTLSINDESKFQFHIECPHQSLFRYYISLTVQKIYLAHHCLQNLR